MGANNFAHNRLRMGALELYLAQKRGSNCLIIKLITGFHCVGYQYLLLVISGYCWLSVVIVGFSWLSLVISGYSWLSVVIVGYQWLLLAISG